MLPVVLGAVHFLVNEVGQRVRVDKPGAALAAKLVCRHRQILKTRFFVCLPGCNAKVIQAALFERNVDVAKFGEQDEVGKAHDGSVVKKARLLGGLVNVGDGLALVAALSISAAHGVSLTSIAKTSTGSRPKCRWDMVFTV